MSSECTKYARGTVWWCYWSDDQLPGVTSGTRPVVILSSNDRGASPSVICACATSRDKPDMKINVTLHISGKQSVIMCNQVRTVSISQLGDYVGVVCDGTMRQIDDALLVALGMERYVDLATQCDELIERINKAANSKLKNYLLGEAEGRDMLAQATAKLNSALLELNALFNDERNDQSVISSVSTDATPTDGDSDPTHGHTIDSSDDTSTNNRNYGAMWTADSANEFVRLWRSSPTDETAHQFNLKNANSGRATYYQLKRKFNID